MPHNQETKSNLNAKMELDKFVDNLVAQKQFDVVPEVLVQIKEDVLERAGETIDATIVANTPPEKLEELEKILDSGNAKELEDFCQTNIPNLQKKITEALTEFAKTYLG